MNPQDQTRRRLLLVEDDDDAAELFRHLHQKICRDWELIWVRDGLEAVSYFMSHHMPDLIVTDLQMPRMNGAELVRWVRSSHEDPKIPIVVFSGNSSSLLEERLKEIGADAYINKFSSLNELKGVLRRYTNTIEEAADEKLALQFDFSKGML